VQQFDWALLLLLEGTGRIIRAAQMHTSIVGGGSSFAQKAIASMIIEVLDVIMRNADYFLMRVQN